MTKVSDDGSGGNVSANDGAAKPLGVIATGTLNLGGGAHPCHVLDDGTPVLGTAQIQGILGARQNRHLAALVANIPSVSAPLNVRAVSWKMTTTTASGSRRGTLAHGYVAEDVIDICVAYSNAFVAGLLKPQQLHIAMRAIAVLNATAKTGIRALVYEAAGYVSPKTLQEHYVANLRDEMAEWSRCFGPEWDSTFCTLYGLPYDGVPPRWMAMVNDRFYRTILGDKLVDEMKRRNPEPKFGSNHHQLLEERAKATVERNMPAFLALAMSSARPADFWANVAVVFKRAPLQLTMLRAAPAA